jgi:hypothetical protein
MLVASTQTHSRVHADVLTFFLGEWKCERGVDLGCEWKHFLDQISNPHVWEINDWIWAFVYFHG